MYIHINTISLIWLVLGKISSLMQVQLAGKTDRPGWYICIYGNLSVLWINIIFHHFKGACDEMSLTIKIPLRGKCINSYCTHSQLTDTHSSVWRLVQYFRPEVRLVTPSSPILL